MDNRELQDTRELQDATRALAEREIYCNLSLMVDALLGSIDADDKEWWEEIEQLKLEATDLVFRCNSCDHDWEESPNFDEGRRCPKCESEDIFENEEQRQERASETEIYEWYSVSNWIATKLKEQGEIIYENWGHCLWGRTGTGQAVALDVSWQTIAKALKDEET